ncbi:Alpha-(1,3)-fucosyltransferase C, partial [Armadillidium nasatum]
MLLMKSYAIKVMAVWMVSHCPVQSKRELFVKELRHYITIDTYGKCGSKKCGDRRTITRTNDFEDDPCLQLIKNYTFYMALENSLCEDYVTEKLYRSLRLGIVPIVLGAVNYSEFAPPNSYIDAKEFTTFSDLANHIKKVASEAKLYN